MKGGMIFFPPSKPGTGVKGFFLMLSDTCPLGVLAVEWDKTGWVKTTNERQKRKPRSFKNNTGNLLSQRP